MSRFCNYPSLIAALFFLLASAYSVITPIFETPDELWHYPFVWQLARRWELPIQDPANPQLWQQEGSQPPLYYALAALLTSPISADDLPALATGRNPHASIGLVSPDGNANIIIHTERENWVWRGAVLAVHLARFFSVLLGTGTVLAVYGLGRTLWPDERAFALLAASFVAFNPMFLFISGSVNNDNLITFLASLTIWRLAVLIVDDLRPPLYQFAILGVVTGLAALTKISGLGLVGLAGLTLLIMGWRRRSWYIAVVGGGLVGLLASSIAGWWYWRNISLYGDWSGTENMVAMMGGRPITPTAGQLWAEMDGLVQSFWGLFGYFSVPMPTPVYWLLNLFMVAGFVGLLAALIHPARSKKLPLHLKQTWPLLLGWMLLLFIGLIQWTLRTPATQGRLLFPALCAVAIFWAAGWMALTPPRLWFLPTVFMFALSVWIPIGLIAPAYALPASLPSLPASAHSLDVTFGDTIKLVGYEEPPSKIQPGQNLPLSLYWRGQKPIKTDYTVFIHLLDENGLIIAQRDVFHGPGVYPTSQWTAGQMFGDTYILSLPRTIYAPAKAHFVVGLYDHLTNKRLPVSSGGDTIQLGNIKVEAIAGDIPNPQWLLFEDNIALVGYELDKRQVAYGETVTLTLYWQGNGQPERDYKVFVHLVGEGDIRAAQHDSDPQNGNAPTSGWQQGQLIVDEHPLTINPDRLPGAFRLVVGLYEGETGRRLRLLRNGDSATQADSIKLGGVWVGSR